VRTKFNALYDQRTRLWAALRTVCVLATEIAHECDGIGQLHERLLAVEPLEAVLYSSEGGLVPYKVDSARLAAWRAALEKLHEDANTPLARAMSAPPWRATPARALGGF